MPFVQADSVRYYIFDIFADYPLTQAVFTRRGGTSPPPWDSLNMGGLVGDERQRVKANLVRAFQAVGRPPGSLYDVWQVHSAKVVRARAPRPEHVDHIKADAILTDRREVTLFMRFADCVPILLYDPVRHVAGMAHAGWQGTVRQMATRAVEAMSQNYHCRPEDIRAGIGPSIGAHHYEIGPEVVEQVRCVFGDQADELLPSRGGAVQFDLWAANRLLLEKSGVGDIQVAGLCTACHLDDWYSHRAENGKTGRFGVLFGLK
jgi:YfiH family protein